MDTLADRVGLVQTESARLTQHLQALPADAWTQRSACTQWQVQDVVAHLSGVAAFYSDTIARGLQGDTTPPEGFPPAGTVNADAMAEPLAQMAWSWFCTAGIFAPASRPTHRCPQRASQCSSS